MSGFLTEHERETFQALTSGDYVNFALVRTKMIVGTDTVDVATVVAVDNDVDDGYVMMPIAVLVNDPVRDALVRPDDAMAMDTDASDDDAPMFESLGMLSYDADTDTLS